MVGVLKLVLDIKALNVPVVVQRQGKPVTTTLGELLSQYNIIEISGEGARQHLKAGLSKEKVLVKAYSKRQGESKEVTSN